MEYIVTRDFAGYKEGDIITPRADLEGWYGIEGLPPIHQDSIDMPAAPFYPIGKALSWVDDFISEVYDLDNDCGKHHAKLARAALLKRAPKVTRRDVDAWLENEKMGNTGIIRCAIMRFLGHKGLRAKE